MSNKVKIKVLITLIISIIMFNFICSNTVMAVYAGETLTSTVQIADLVESNPSIQTGTTSQTQASKDESLMTQAMDLGKDALDGIVGIFWKMVASFPVIVGGAMHFIGNSVGQSAGSSNEAQSNKYITAEDILFNRLAITDINFFDITHFGSGSNKQQLSGSNNPIQLLKESVANWYSTLRTIAMIILICVLIYVGIRMVLASSPEAKYSYKKMLIDWLVSFAMLFLLHYFILLIITINNVLVDIIGSVNGLQVGGASATGFWDTYLPSLVSKVYSSSSGVEIIGTALAYLGICFVTLVFLVMYIKRMITLAFLILISPLITITYSIDRIGNGKSEAFTNWMKEFFRTVLLQPFHCIIYVSIVSIAMGFVQKNGTIGSLFLLILAFRFMAEAERIIKTIFELNTKTTDKDGLMTAVMVSKFLGSAAKPVTNMAGKFAEKTGLKTNNKSKSRVAEENMEEVENTDQTTDRPEDKNVQHNQGKHNFDNFEEKAEKFNKYSGDVKDNSKNAEDAAKKATEEVKTSGITKDAAKEAVDELNRSGVIKDAAREAAKQVENGKNDINVQSTDQKSTLSKVGDYAKAGAGFAVKSSMQLGGALTGFAVSTMGGANLSEITAATLAGKKTGDYLYDGTSNLLDSSRNKLDNTVRAIAIKNNEATLANRFDDYKNGEKYNLKKDLQDVRDYLSMSSKKVDDMQEGSEKQYVQSIHAMREIYNKNFEDDPNQRVMKTMEKIIKERVKPEN